MFDPKAIDRIRAERAAWEANELAEFVKRQPESRPEYRTGSGLPVQRVYTPDTTKPQPLRFFCSGEKYEFWKSLIRTEGPTSLRRIKGFHDETLKGSWKGYRSSRLTKQWRVIYKVEGQTCRVYVERVTPHDYRR